MRPSQPAGVVQPDPSAQPTQIRHPWRATLRTVIAAAVAGLTLLPEIASEAHIGTVPTVVQVVAASAAITRILAIPSVNTWLTTYAPWLAAAPPS